jgi:uncharacterized protein (DUF1697 family)
MQTYISLLRGINVSGQKIIKMDDLRRVYEHLNFHNVRTYVQSGNVIFQTKESNQTLLQQKINAEIAREFGFDVPVLIMSIQQLKQTIGNNPFAKDVTKEQSFLHVTFLAESPVNMDIKAITDKKLNNEDIAFTPCAVYLYCPAGYGSSKLSNNLIEAKLRVKASTRNWKTSNELLKIALEVDALRSED